MADTTVDPARFHLADCDPEAPCAGFLVCDAHRVQGVVAPVAALAWAAPAEGCDPEAPCAGFLIYDRHRQTTG
ncbi:hypothetical protein ACWC5I_43050 [Kitasatospora sp. NPDC001574]